jgi:glycosyltransferase involved in cell wall biosynthesis
MVETPVITVTNVSRVNRAYGQRVLRPDVPTQVPQSFLEDFGARDPALRYDFSKALGLLRTLNDDGVLQIDWRSPLSMAEGYGRHAIWLIRALIARGLELNVRDVGWVPADWMPEDINQLRHNGNRSLPSRIGVAMTLGYDPQLAGQSSPIRIGITQFETGRLPREHVNNVNQLDHVIVTSQFGKKMFRDSGVRTPISAMRPGIPAADFPYQERPKDGLFKVLVLGALTARKNPEGAVRIFKAASQGNPDWRLTMKTRTKDFPPVVRHLVGDDPRIRLVSSDEPPHLLQRWYYGHDCFLWPSKGEGLGLPPLEAMASGMELVCANHSGMADYVDEEICYPIFTDHRESAVTQDGFNQRYVNAFGDVGEWWVPDEAHGARQLRKCFNNWLDGHGRGHHASQVMAAKFPMSNPADDIIAVLKEYL